ncbi:hypothetical protein LP420_31005 [Massilia sp. B-10]|nr:hypothetical protein LP420_31005 [Massilia sp. B-10]
MRITVVSTDDKQLTELARQLRERSSADEISVLPASLERLLGIAEPGAIDVLVLAQDTLDAADTERLERLGYAMPNTAMILVSSQQTPEFLLQAMRSRRARSGALMPAAPATLYPALRRIADKQAKAAPTHAARCSPSSPARAAAAPPSWPPISVTRSLRWKTRRSACST